MRRRVAVWLAETHGCGLELLRHFLARFFDSEMLAGPGEWLRVTLGAAGLLVLTWPVVWLTWQLKYNHLSILSSPEPYRAAVREDQLWLIALAMCCTAAATAVQWQSLFPGRRDLMALAAMPIRPAEIFLAKFGALLAVFTAFALAVNVVPAYVFAAVSESRWQESSSALWNTFALAAATIGACAFVFFGLVALQGMLLNLLPARLFARISVGAQAILFTAALGALPFLSRQQVGDARLPSQWFLDLWGALIETQDGSAGRAATAMIVAPALAVATYLLSYRRYQRVLLEEPAQHGRQHWLRIRRVACRLFDWWIRDPREQALFVFIAKTMARSRNHRLILLAYAGIAAGWILKGAVGGSRDAGPLIVIATLTVSVSLIAGLRYLLALPVELRANWIFQTTEPPDRTVWLRAVERFVVWCGVAPVILAAFPFAAAALGISTAAAVTLLEFAFALLVFEYLFLTWRKAPFACSYFPAKRPLVFVLAPALGSLLLLAGAGGILLYCATQPTAFLAMLALLLWAWYKLRARRMARWTASALLFEDNIEPAVMTLGIGPQSMLESSDQHQQIDSTSAPVARIPWSAADPPVGPSQHAVPRGILQRADEGVGRGPGGPPYERGATLRELAAGGILDDLRHGLRLLRRNPTLSAVVVATLAVGIGMNATVLTLLDGIAFRSGIQHDPETFAMVVLRDRAMNMTRPASAAEYDAYARNAHSARRLAAWSHREVSLGDDDRTGTWTLLVTCNFFDVTGAQRALAGRLLTPDDCQTPGQAHVAVLTEELWRARFGGDPRMVGSVIHADGVPFEVVGVAPARSAGRILTGGLILPYTAEPQLDPSRNLFQDQDRQWLAMAARVAPQSSRTAMQAELAILAQQQDALHLGRRTAVVVTDGSWIENPDLNSSAFWAMGLIVGAFSLVLLIACANVTTLLLSKAAVRQREIAVRLALGAAKLRVLRMLLIESLTLALIAGALGLAVAYRAPGPVHQFVGHRPADFPLAPGPWIYAYIAVVVLFTGCISGIAPALESLKADLTESLKGRGSFLGTAGGGQKIRHFLVSAQVAFSLVLLVGAAVFGRAQFRLLHGNPGFETRKVLIAPLHFPRRGETPQSRSKLWQIAEAVASLPEIESVAYANDLPVLGRFTMDVKIAGRTGTEPVAFNSASPGYFATLGMPIVRGREFRRSDLPGGAATLPVIVSENFARTFFPHQDPLGQRLEVAQGILQVIGVTKDINPDSFGATDRPVAYWLGQPNLRSNLLVRFRGGATSAAEAVRAAIHSVAPELVITPEPFQKRIDDAAAELSGVVALVMTLGFVGAALALTGIYGAVSFAVTQMTRDLGIRAALGAQRRDIVREVLTRGGKPVAYGLVVGVWLSLVFATVMQQAFRQSPVRLVTSDPLVYIAAVLLLGLAGLAAMIGPARRGAQTDPLDALRWE